MAHQQTSGSSYYVPEPSHWPVVGSLALFFLMWGLAHFLHGEGSGVWFLGAGFLLLLYMLVGWFSTVIRESCSGLYSDQVDRSFRLGMMWFIFTEVMFFGAFFGSLFYARWVVVPWLGGHAQGDITQLLLWPNFVAHWPMLKSPDTVLFHAIGSVIPAWEVPALNTLILLTSGATITWAHWGLLQNRRGHLIVGLLLTILLGIAFLCLQAHEYHVAYVEHGLKLSGGIFGTTFFVLTGFHGLHVTLGTIMLIVVWCRCLKGHFGPKGHFAFEAVSWYWHFVDVVWLFLFVCVYWL